MQWIKQIWRSFLALQYLDDLLVELKRLNDRLDALDSKILQVHQEVAPKIKTLG